MFARSGAVLLTVIAALGCERQERQQTTFYSRRIGPVLEGSCATSPTRSGCHVSADGIGNALGNLSVESYEKLNLRRDLLVNYGPYGVPGLLLKVVPQFSLSLTPFDSNEPILIKTNIAHVGSQQVDFASPTYAAIERWITDGAAENNAPQAPRVLAAGACSTTSSAWTCGCGYPCSRSRCRR